VSMILVAAVAADTRYIGVTLIATGGLLVLFDPSRPWRRKWLPALVFGLGSLTLVTWNLVRNYLTVRQLAGEREKALNSLATNLYYFGSTVGQWLVPADMGRNVAIGFGILIVLVLCLLLFRWLVRGRGWGSFEFIALIFAVVYALSIIGISSVSRFENMDSRLLIPMFIPLLWALSRPLLDLARTPGKRLWRLAGIGIALAALFAVQAEQLIQDGENYDGIKDAGMPGYSEDSWQQSPTVDYLRHHPEIFSQDNTVYSDADDGIFYLTGKLADILPHKDNPGEIREMFLTPSYYVVWLTDAIDPDLVSLSFISSHQELECLARFSDGAIYYHGAGQAVPASHP
ncbi:MAG TPA: hypothetical protein VMV20_04650, partial [Chitinophagaceae bacterium]|nr:hypothetical protein [Chitinophagaceae bacterium]